MSEENSFARLIEQLRQGDNDAARQVLDRYEPALRRIVGMRLMDRRLRGLVDKEDICQSVFGSFFVRLSLGQYEIAEEQDLLRLLATMVRNKVATKKRRRTLEYRDDVLESINRRRAETRTGGEESPSYWVVYQDLVQAAEGMLTADERELIALRKAGVGWVEIANKTGDDPECLRKRIARTVDLVIEQLGLEETRRGKK